jgi:hypothetical protein
MKIIKRILLVLVVLIALILIIAAFIDTDYHVERSIVINKPSGEVFEYVKYLKNQDEYAVWNKMDPKAKKKYSGTDGTVGFISGWDSKNENVGTGEQEIISISEGKRVDMELRFKEPFESVAKAYMTTSAKSSDQTTVEWGLDGHTPYPFNFMMLFMDMDEMLGKDLDGGLKNMKVILESGQTTE